MNETITLARTAMTDNGTQCGSAFTFGVNLARMSARNTKDTKQKRKQTKRKRKAGEACMTIHEFAAKYAVPYHVAYKASFRLKPVSATNREREFNESELLTETKKYIRRRLIETKDLYTQYAKAYENLKKQA